MLHLPAKKEISLKKSGKSLTEYCERKRLHARYHPVDETVVNAIALNAREEGVNAWDRDVKRYLKSDRVMTFNPFDAILPLKSIVVCTPELKNL